MLAQGDQGGARQPARGDEPAARRRSAKASRRASIAGAWCTGREKTLYSIYKKMREKHLTFSQVLDIFGLRVIVADKSDLLRRARRAARALQADPRQVQGLHRDPEGERLPVAAHDAVRPVRHAARSRRSAPHDMHRVAEAGVAAHWLYKTGGRARPRRSAARDAPLAAEPARDPARVARLAGVPRARQGRPLPRRGLRVHAEGQDHGAAARRDRRRLRLRACTPTSATTASRRGSTTSWCRCAPSCKNGDHVEIITRRRARPNPAWLSVRRAPARRARSIRHYLKTHAAEGVGGARRAAAEPGARDAEGRARVDHLGSLGSAREGVRLEERSSKSSPTSASASGCRSSSRRR